MNLLFKEIRHNVLLWLLVFVPVLFAAHMLRPEAHKFALGLSLADRKVGHMREVIWLSTLKLIVNPLATFALVSWVFVMDPFWAKAAVLLSAMVAQRGPRLLSG